MKTIKKNVYYCDFCKKKGLSKYHLEIHEKQSYRDIIGIIGLYSRLPK